MDGRVQGGVLRTALQEASLSPGELWIEYCALGGKATQFELEAFLNAVILLPAFERDLLADACNSLLKQTAVTTRIPQSREDEPDETGEDPWKGLGAAGAFLLAPEQIEMEWLHALEHTGLLATEPESRFDRFTRQAVTEFGVGTAFVILVDDRRMFLKSVIGSLEQDLPRSIAFCTATLRGGGPLVVPDTLTDERFRDHPLVAEEPHLRFYAGHPLRGPGHWVVGIICLADQRPRAFTHEDQQAFHRLAVDVEAELPTGS